MTPEQFIQWQARCGLSNNDTRKALGVSLRTVYHFRSGESTIPRPVALACEALAFRASVGMPLEGEPMLEGAPMPEGKVS